MGRMVSKAVDQSPDGATRSDDRRWRPTRVSRTRWCCVAKNPTPIQLWDC